MNPIKILLIEDDADFIHLLKERLLNQKNFFFEVESVERVPQALDRLAKGSVDLILLDLNLADSKGLDTLHSILPKTEEIPVIVITGEYDESIGLEALKLGAEDYLLKGQLEPALLVRSIRYALERKRHEGVLREAYTEVKQLIAAVPSILIRINHKNEVRFWNKEAERAFDLSFPQVMHKALAACGLDWDFNVLQKGIDECRAKRRPIRLDDISFKRANGEARIFGATVSPIETSEGTSVLIYGADITQRRRLEAELPQRRPAKN